MTPRNGGLYAPALHAPRADFTFDWQNTVSESADLHAAIAALEAQRHVLGEGTVIAASQALRARLVELQRSETAEAEWKQVTVLFADISGFTALSEAASAEDVRNTMNACFERMGEVAARYGGYIDKFIGDEMMVLFGAPRAQEAHAARALYAALEIREAVTRFNREGGQPLDRPLGVHLGVNSGLIVAGAIGTLDRRDYTVMGDAVNVAARLVARSAMGEILVGESTRHLGGHDFEFEHLGEVQLEGHRPAIVSRLLRARYSVPLRGGVSTRVRMLGREEELFQLQRAFHEINEFRQPRCVAVLGPAGIGKSRLQVEFLAWAHAEHADAAILLGNCLPHMATTPYFLFTDLLRKWLGVTQADSGAEVRERLENSLAGIGINDPGTVHALGAVMAIEYVDDQLRILLPEERRQRIFAAFLTLCERISARGPTVLVLEDIHWADDLSLDILDLLSRQRETALLLFALSRPESDPAAEARQIEARLANAGYLRLDLKKLDEAATAELVTALAPGLDRSTLLVAAIAEKGQGNPFFVEAIVNALFDQGVIEQDEAGLVRQRQQTAVSVPDTVWDVLAERLDRLGANERRVLQSAAVVGPVFWEGLVGELAGCETSQPLDTLRRREFIDLQGPAPFASDWEWLFRHALVQEVAYSSLLVETRRAAHIRVAGWLRERAGDRLSEYVTLLAHHYLLGEGWEDAANFAELAGDRASGLFAYGDARASYLEALESLRHLADSDGVRRCLVAVTLKLAAASFYTPSAEIFRALERADTVARELGDTESHIKLLVAVASWQFMAGQGSAAVGTASRTVEEAAKAGFDRLLSVPFSLLGKAFYIIGEYDKSVAALEKSRELTNAAGDDPLARYHLVPTLGYLGSVLELQGRLADGLAEQVECLRVAEQRQDLRQIGAAHIYFGASASFQGNLAKAFEHMTVAADLLEGRGDPVALYCTLGFLGCVYAQRNELDLARKHLDRALGMAADAGSFIFVPLFQAYRADIEIRAGHAAEAIEPLRAAITLGVKSQQRQNEAEAHRILGWALHHASPGADGEAAQEFATAVRIYRDLGAPVLLSRALFDLAAFLRGIGDAQAAAETQVEAVALARAAGADWLPFAGAIPVPSGTPVAESAVVSER